jgi:glyoxylase-like metal-dependent hydrolase (beta-lactamase superfamily II)
MHIPAADQLEDIGKAPDDVRNVVITHMHPDHVGGIEDFPHAAMWVGRDDWESADEAGPLGRPDTSPFDQHAVVKTVEFTGTAPYGPFNGHVDLFGDGSIILLPAPGHTPGHMAVLVNLPGGSFLLTGDCAWIDRHWTEPALKGSLVRSLVEDDWERNWANQWRIHEWSKTFPGLTVVAGHERANLEALKRWPEAYE